MRVVGALACLLLAGTALGPAQEAVKPLEFEAVSIKPRPSADAVSFGTGYGGPGTSSPGQWVQTNISLRTLIGMAFGLKNYEGNWAVGLPPEGKATYDVTAKVPRGASRSDFRLMLQALLDKRFGLIYHWAPRSVPSYDLVVAKTGPKLLPAAPPNPGTADQVAEVPRWRPGQPWPELPPGVPRMLHWAPPATDGGFNYHVAARMESVDDLAEFLEDYSVVDRPVENRTGLKGAYDFTLDYTTHSVSAGSAASGGTGPVEATEPDTDAFRALERQLGLRLVRSKSVVKVLVVTHFNIQPTDE